MGDCTGGLSWRCVAAAARLRGYVGGGVDGMTRGASSLGGEEDGGGGEEDHEDGEKCSLAKSTSNVGEKLHATIAGSPMVR